MSAELQTLAALALVAAAAIWLVRRQFRRRSGRGCCPGCNMAGCADDAGNPSAKVPAENRDRTS